MANKIVEKSRREAEKTRFLEKNRIIEIKPEPDRFCNCCGIKEENNKGLQVGHHGYTTQIILCSECLSKLGDAIWEVQ